MRLTIAVFLLSSLAACGSDAVSRQDVIGEFCGRALSTSGRARDYVLKISNDGNYEYSVYESKLSRILFMDGSYGIYGEKPVERIELAAICFSPGSRQCGDYPAEVMLEGGKLQIIVEDERGTPVTLEKRERCMESLALPPRSWEFRGQET